MSIELIKKIHAAAVKAASEIEVVDAVYPGGLGMLIADTATAIARADMAQQDPGEQYTVLSDPEDLKVGDWIQWAPLFAALCLARETPVQVVKVCSGYFADSAEPDECKWTMEGGSYRVVPAPKGGE